MAERGIKMEVKIMAYQKINPQNPFMVSGYGGGSFWQREGKRKKQRKRCVCRKKDRVRR